MEKLLRVVEVRCSRQQRAPTFPGMQCLFTPEIVKTIFNVERSRQWWNRGRRCRRRISSTTARSESGAVGLSGAACCRSRLANAATDLLALVAPPGESQ